MKPPQPTVLAHNVQQFSAVCSFEEPDAVPRPEFDVPLSSVFSSGGSKPSIAQWVGGGGAGLLQHDMMLAIGGRPANHTDTNPGAGIEEKFKVTIRAIFDNPNKHAFFNFKERKS